MTIEAAPATTAFLQIYGVSQPHAVLLSGPTGIGLNSLAHELVARSGTLLAEVRPEAKTRTSLPVINVERIRRLYDETRARFDTTHIVIIDDADTMNPAAQNALLKLLEEPNPSVAFILTTHAPDRLLPTIRSRVQSFVVPPISSIDSRRLLQGLGVKETSDEQRLMFVAEGLPAELTRLTGGSGDFKTLSERVQRARQFIEGTTYQRLALIQTLKDDRAGTLLLIDTIVMLLRRTLRSSPDRPTVALIDRLVDAAELIRANGHVRLHLSAAVV